MKTLGSLSFSLFLAMLLSGTTRAQSASAPSFEHDNLSCMSTSEFPVVEAEIDPAALADMRLAHVYFKSSQGRQWYYVDMERVEGASRFRAALPKPLAETNRVHYYLFFITSYLESSQSEEYSVRVSEGGCAAAPSEVMSSPTSLILRATTANQPPIPAGFSPQGISGLVTTAGNTVAASGAAASASASSGGLSGATIGAIAGAGAAAGGATAVVVAGGDNNEDGDVTAGDVSQGDTTSAGSSTEAGTPAMPAPAPAPMPEPMPEEPSVTSVAGTWRIVDRITESCIPSIIGQTSTNTMMLQQNGTTLSGSVTSSSTTGTVNGTIDADGKITLRGQVLDDGQTADLQIEGQTTDGSEMSGTFSQYYPDNGCRIGGTFTGSKS